MCGRVVRVWRGGAEGERRRGRQSISQSLNGKVRARWEGEGEDVPAEAPTKGGREGATRRQKMSHLQDWQGHLPLWWALWWVVSATQQNRAGHMWATQVRRLVGASTSTPSPRRALSQIVLLPPPPPPARAPDHRSYPFSSTTRACTHDQGSCPYSPSTRADSEDNQGKRERQRRGA